MLENPARPSRRRSTFTPPFRTISSGPDRGAITDPPSIVPFVWCPRACHCCRRFADDKMSLWGKTRRPFYFRTRWRRRLQTDRRGNRFADRFPVPLLPPALGDCTRGPIVSSLLLPLLLLLLLFLLPLSSSSDAAAAFTNPLRRSATIWRTHLLRVLYVVHSTGADDPYQTRNFSSIVRRGLSYNGRGRGRTIRPIIIVLHPITVCNARPRYTSHTGRLCKITMRSYFYFFC